MRVLRAAAEAAASTTTTLPALPPPSPTPTPALLTPAAAADELAKTHALQLSRASSSTMDNSEGIMDLSKKDTQSERPFHQNYAKSIDVNRNDIISSNNKNEID